ncbi:hypothetical protein EMCRGX_G019456 [Ephydatia muelleri]
MGNISSRSIASDERQTKVVIRPMLTTAQKNFRTVKDCPTIESGYLPPDITREELNVPGSRCFLLHSVLTPEECAHYIHETEQVGYEDLTRLFPVEYRSNDRVLSICKPLVECLWRRIEPHLTRKEVICIRPVGFGNEGTWRPSRLNECCKFGKYKCGAHFSPHLDGPWVPNEEESSIFTVVIYLNSDLEGGATSFLSEGGKVICSVSPKAGNSSDSSTMTRCMRAKLKMKTISKQWPCIRSPGNLNKLEMLRDLLIPYLEGLALQCQSQRTVGKDTSEIFEQVLPYEVFMKIFSYLSVQDLCTALVICKAWYTMCMDGQLWYQLYMRKWQHVNMEAQSIETTKSFNKLDPVPFTKDWYGKYKQRILANLPHYQKLACVDLGSYCCKFATIENCNSDSIITSSVESVVAIEPPGLWNEDIRARIAAPFLRQLCSPSVAFLSSAVAILAGLDMNCGVVLDIGREKCYNNSPCEHD